MEADTMTYEKMRDFTEELFTIDNLNMVSTGLNVDKLEALAADDWEPISGQTMSPPASTYHGGLLLQSFNSFKITPVF